MTLRGKLLVAQGPLAAALVLLGVTTYLATSALGERSGRILRDNYRSVLAAERIKEAIARIETAALRLASGGGAAAADELARHRQSVESALAIVEGNVTEAGEREVVDTLRGSWEAGALDAAAARADVLLRINQAAMTRHSDQARATARRVERLVVAVAVVGLLLGLAASVLLTARLLRPLGALSAAVHRVGAGDFTARADVATPDEIGRLTRDFNVMAGRLESYRNSSRGALLLSQRQAQAVLDGFPDPVVVLGIDGAISNMNHAAEARLQIHFEAGTDALARLDPALVAALGQLREHVAGGGVYAPKGLDESVRLPSADGEQAFLPRATPLYDDAGRLAGVTVVLQEVTRLLRFDQLKDDLVATVAHEVRTPLTSLRMAAHLLAERAVGPLTDKQAELVYASRDDLARLQAIVDDLLDLSRIQHGRMELALRRVGAGRLIAEVVDTHRGAAEEAGVTLRAEVGGEADVLADADRIQLVLTNLVVNAIRHSPAGAQIVVRARPAGAQLRFEVVDAGGGIAEEHRAAVFERFFRVPGTPGRGAGLGLYIAREIVRAHGGEIGFDSGVGRGTTFWFQIASASSGASRGAAAETAAEPA